MEELPVSRHEFIPKSPYKTSTMFRKPPSAKFRVDEMIGYINYEYPTKRPKKRPIPRFCYVCCRTSPYKHLYVDPYASCPHFSSGPHPSFVSEVEIRKDFRTSLDKSVGTDPAIRLFGDQDDDDTKEDDDDEAVFDTSVLALNEDEDPNQFNLPPMFNDGPTTMGKKKPKRVIPTVSENTFISSNFKTGEEDDDNDNESYRFGKFQEKHKHSKRSSKSSSGKDDTREKFREGQGRLKLPEIGQNSNLVTSAWTEDDITEEERALKSRERKVKFLEVQHKQSKQSHQPLSSREGSKRRDGDDLEPGLTSRSDPGLQRTMTLESEPTGASLHIDEDYIPMSVTIKKLTEADMLERGYSDYQDFSDVLSSSLSGSLGVSRETSLGSSEGDSPTSFMNRLREASWCECSHVTNSPAACPECRLTSGHEKWCVSAGSMCHMCRKPIKKLSTHRRRASRQKADSDKADDTVADLTTRQIPHAAKCPSDKPSHKEHSKRRHKHKSKRESDDTRKSHNSETLMEKQLQRVRFNDTIQQVSPDNRARLPKTALDYESLDNYDHESMTYKQAKQLEKDLQNYQDGLGNLGWMAMEEREVDEEEAKEIKKKLRRPKSLDEYRIPNLGVNVHKMAYLLALQDSRLKEGNTKKKKKGKKAGKEGEAKPEGTIFSYFPLLKQPASMTELNIGLRQNHGKNVKLKNAMKHIFGNVKFGEYYPGGSKFRKIQM